MNNQLYTILTMPVDDCWRRVVYNVHSLLHLKSDIDALSSPDNCAAWPFKNYMQRLKRKVKGGNNPAAQLVKRVLEYMDLDAIPDQKKNNGKDNM